MDSRWTELKTLFYAALDLRPDERAAFLDERCGVDPELRAEVERLLAAHEQASSFRRVRQFLQPSLTKPSSRTATQVSRDCPLEPG